MKGMYINIYRLLVFLSIMNILMLETYSYEGNKNHSINQGTLLKHCLSPKSFIQPELQSISNPLEIDFQKIVSVFDFTTFLLEFSKLIRTYWKTFISSIFKRSYLVLIVNLSIIMILFEGGNLSYGKSAEFLKIQAPKVVTYWEKNHGIPLLKDNYIDFDGNGKINSDERVKSIFVWIKKHHVYPPFIVREELGDLDSPEVLESRYLHCYRALEMFYGILRNHNLQDRIVIVHVTKDHRGKEVSHAANLFLNIDKKGKLTDVTMMDLTAHFMINEKDDYLYNFEHQRIGVFNKKNRKLVYYSYKELRALVRAGKITISDISPNEANTLAIEYLNPYNGRLKTNKAFIALNKAFQTKDFSNAIELGLERLKFLGRKLPYFENDKKSYDIYRSNFINSAMMLLVAYGNSANIAYNNKEFDSIQSFIEKGDKILNFLKPYYKILEKKDKKQIDWFISNVKMEPEKVLFSKVKKIEKITDPIVVFKRSKRSCEDSLKYFKKGRWEQALSNAQKSLGDLTLLNNISVPSSVAIEMPTLNVKILEIIKKANHNIVADKLARIELLLNDAIDLYNKKELAGAKQNFQEAVKLFKSIKNHPASIKNYNEIIRKEIMRLAPYLSSIHTGERKNRRYADVDNFYRLDNHHGIFKSKKGTWVYFNDLANFWRFERLKGIRFSRYDNSFLIAA